MEDLGSSFGGPSARDTEYSEGRSELTEATKDSVGIEISQPHRFCDVDVYIRSMAAFQLEFSQSEREKQTQQPAQGFNRQSRESTFRRLTIVSRGHVLA